MRLCPKCGKSYPDDAAFCVKDGVRLDEDDVLFDDGAAKGEISGPLDTKTGIGPGSTVGSYRVLSQLGKGGMGIVYLGEHTRLGRRVAIKVLRPEYVGDLILVRRFFDEARAANQVGHENIVEVFDFVEEGAHRYYVMELLEGEPLAAAMEGTRPLELARTYRIAAQVADALAAVHDKGIVHRDLKPDNIFLIKRSRQRDFVKLLDFGIAKLLDREQAEGETQNQTQTGMMLGTPAYMAPEQLKAQRVDRRADIYAFGVILYQMVTGVRPFRAKSIPELMMLHCHEPPPPMRFTPNLPHEIPLELERLILQCLAKEPDHRPFDMHEVEVRIEALAGDALEGSGPTPRPATNPGVPAYAQSQAEAAASEGPTAPMRTQGPKPPTQVRTFEPEVTRKAFMPSISPTQEPSELPELADDEVSDASDANEALAEEAVAFESGESFVPAAGERAGRIAPALAPGTGAGTKGAVKDERVLRGALEESEAPRVSVQREGGVDPTPMPSTRPGLERVDFPAIAEVAPPRSRAPLLAAAGVLVALAIVGFLASHGDDEPAPTAGATNDPSTSSVVATNAPSTNDAAANDAAMNAADAGVLEAAIEAPIEKAAPSDAAAVADGTENKAVAKKATRQRTGDKPGKTDKTVKTDKSEKSDKSDKANKKPKTNEELVDPFAN